MMGHTESELHDCKVVDLGMINNPAGNITVIDDFANSYFDIKRIYYLYDVPGGSERGGHAHKDLNQIIVAASGSFQVIIDDGKSKKVVNLNRPNHGLVVVPGIWREIVDFSSGAICLVLASLKYDEEDYIRNYEDFKQYKLKQ